MSVKKVRHSLNNPIFIMNILEFSVFINLKLNKIIGAINNKNILLKKEKNNVDFSMAYV